VEPRREPLRILVVCTANVCRSPLAADVLRTSTTGTTGTLVTLVTSAGTEAEPGEPRCAQSSARAGHDDAACAAHRARLLTPDLLEQADLILTLDRTHLAAAARLAPACRPRMFTLRQAAAIAQQIAANLERAERPDGLPALPPNREDHPSWLVAELDADRVAVDGWPEGREDIPDDHGTPAHGASLDQVAATAGELAAALTVLARSRTCPG
jgi:protein-tyrosine phosphatase